MSKFRPTTAHPIARKTRLTEERGLNRTVARERRDPLSPTAFSSLETLIRVRWHDGPDVRPMLLRVLIDLYVQKPSHRAEEEQQFVELALRLLDAVDAQTRTEVAQRLATYVGAPAAVLCRLAIDSSAPETVAPTSREVCRPGARLQQPEASAANIPSCESNWASIASELNEIFFAANPTERRSIMINLDYSSVASRQLMSAASADKTNHALEATALHGRPDEFVRELEHAVKVSRQQAQRIINDRSGEPLVVATRALAMRIDMLQRILLCGNPAIGHSVRRVYDLCALYKDISFDSALRLVAIWRAASPVTRIAAEHHSICWGDDPRSRRDFAVTSRRSPSRLGGCASRLRHQLTR
jgi:hypothetical protein